MNKIILKSIAAALLTGFAVASMAEVVITTGAGYQPMVKELNAAYAQAGNKALTENYGGHIGQMITQIASGSPVNVVITDLGTLKGLNVPVEFAVEQPLGETPLVFVWGKGTKVEGVADIETDKVKTFAYPDAKAAVYGKAAKAYLDGKNLSEKLKDKTIEVSSVPQVIAYVTKGEVDAGFVNRSAARSAKDKLGGMQEVTEGYPKIEMAVVVVKGHENDPEIKKFLEFLQTEEAKKILDKHGVS
ncbi:MAG: molybdate ABC transporter substrate-binding protein [Burkholderiales bacterium]|nr:molybdate ABC transporter substrate-binding protein [Burkholderiales bacterium]